MTKKTSRTKTILGILAFVWGFQSCDYLNVEPYINDMLSLDSVFARSDYLHRYLYGAAGHLPNEGQLYSSSFGPFETAVDESFMSYRKAEYAGTFFSLGEVTEFSGYYNQWPGYYQGIRKANNVITRINECRDMDDFERRDVLGMAYFLKGYLSMHLLQLYGPFVILPEEVLPVNIPTESLSYPRSTYDSCVNYICEMMDRAEELLPESWAVDYNTRPTKYAAMAVKSRVRLYQASPWYNGNAYYQNWLTEEGEPFIAQEYSEEKWAVAAAEAKRLIETGNFSLHTIKRDVVDLPFEPCPEVMDADFPNGSRDIDPFLSYNEMFTGEVRPEENPELIYLGGNVQALNIVVPLNNNGWNSLNVPAKIVDAYYMRDGRDINDSSDEYPYDPTFMTPGTWSENGAVNIYEQFSNGSTAEEGRDTYKIGAYVNGMYVNREARFYANIGFNGRYFAYGSVSKDQTQTPINYLNWYYLDKMEVRSNPEDKNLSGYTCVKYLHPDDSYAYGSVRNKPFMAFRYAEILLNYVEAINHLTTSYTVGDVTVSRDPAEIVKYFNMIRYRAGIPGITLSDAADEKRVTELIKRERMIEFLHEGRRYHDLRRWGDAEVEESKPLLGMDMTANSNEPMKFHTEVPITHAYAKRNFSRKMYFYPIPRSAMEQNPKLIQNYGW